MRDDFIKEVDPNSVCKCQIINETDKLQGDFAKQENLTHQGNLLLIGVDGLPIEPKLKKEAEL